VTTYDPEEESTALVRSYVITNGQELAKGDRFSMTTLVTASDRPAGAPVLDPEKSRVLSLCSGGYLSVAEIAGHTGLPVGVVRILLADLAGDGHLLTRAPVPRAVRVDRELLEEVMHGLQRRFG
jgi:hypothetical protein